MDLYKLLQIPLFICFILYMEKNFLSIKNKQFKLSEMQKITAEICAKCLRRKLKNFSGKKNISVIECVVSEIPTGPGNARTGHMRPVRKKNLDGGIFWNLKKKT